MGEGEGKNEGEARGTVWCVGVSVWVRGCGARARCVDGVSYGRSWVVGVNVYSQLYSMATGQQAKMEYV